MLGEQGRDVGHRTRSPGGRILKRNKGRPVMILNWVDGFEINVRIENGTVIISANKEGLLSLADHFKSLAEEPSGSHIHLDAYNSLENDSAELILEKI